MYQSLNPPPPPPPPPQKKKKKKKTRPNRRAAYYRYRTASVSVCTSQLFHASQ